MTPNTFRLYSENNNISDIVLYVYVNYSEFDKTLDYSNMFLLQTYSI